MALLLLMVFLIGCATGIEQMPTKYGRSTDIGPDSISSNAPTQAIDSESEDESDPSPVLPNHGPAPELTNEVWLNSDHPLRMADLRGKVVLLEMWTFG